MGIQKDLDQYQARIKKARKYANRTNDIEIRKLLLGLADDNEGLFELTFSERPAKMKD